MWMSRLICESRSALKYEIRMKGKSKIESSAGDEVRNGKVHDGGVSPRRSDSGQKECGESIFPHLWCRTVRTGSVTTETITGMLSASSLSWIMSSVLVFPNF